MDEAPQPKQRNKRYVVPSKSSKTANAHDTELNTESSQQKSRKLNQFEPIDSEDSEKVNVQTSKGRKKKAT